MLIKPISIEYLRPNDAWPARTLSPHSDIRAAENEAMFASLQFPVQGLLRDRAWIRAQQFQHRFLQNPGTDLDRRLRETGVSIRREKDLFNGSAFFSGADQEDLVVI